MLEHRHRRGFRGAAPERQPLHPEAAAALLVDGGGLSLPFGDVTETSARVPSLLAAIAAILAVYRLGLLFYGRRAAWLAALVFGTCTKINWQGHVGQIDMLLTALVVWSVYFWASGYVLEGAAALLALLRVRRPRHPGQGPVGLLPPLLVDRDLPRLARPPGPARVSGLARPAALGRGGAAWLGPALYWGGELYQREILFKQNVTRYVDPWHHYQPPWYYLGVLPGDFLPWTLLVPAALLAAWRLSAARSGNAVFFLLVWVLTTLVFFSLSPAKRTVYILTLYPAMALLTGAGLDLLARRAAEIQPALSRWWLRLPALALPLLLALAGIAALILGPARKEAALLGADLPYLLGGALLAAAALLAWAARELWRGRVEKFVTIEAAAFALFLVFAWSVVIPRLDPVKSARGLSQKLLEVAAPGEPYGIYPRLDATLLFIPAASRSTSRRARRSCRNSPNARAGSS